MRITDVGHLKSILNYDPETGIFTSRKRKGIGDGKEVGQVCSKFGYLRIKAGPRLEQAHRLAWLYYYGNPPNGEIDHINGDKLDNRIANLRLASRAQNIANRGVRKDSKTGIKGVSFHKERWIARIKHNGEERRLGSFRTPEEAKAAYDAAHRALYGQFSPYGEQ